MKSDHALADFYNLTFIAFNKRTINGLANDVEHDRTLQHRKVYNLVWTLQHVEHSRKRGRIVKNCNPGTLSP